jgi:acetolactate synthase regulatory subunit
MTDTAQGRGRKDMTRPHCLTRVLVVVRKRRRLTCQVLMEDETEGEDV